MFADRKAIVAMLQQSQVSDCEFIPGRIRYTDLYKMASSFHRRFLELEDNSVPVCLAVEDRGVLAAALLAAFASGTVLALPHSFSQIALQEMQAMTGFTAAVVDGEKELPATVLQIFPSTTDTDEPLSFAAAALEGELLRLFTGGSTGAPKIWSKTAGNIFSEAAFMIDEFSITDRDVIVATISPWHIYGLLFSVVIPLMASAAVLGETPLFPAEIAEYVQQNEATIFVSVPAHYRVLKDRQISDQLRIAFSSAGMLDREDNEAFFQHNSVPVMEVYGSTETGGLAARNRFLGEEYFTPLKPVRWQIKGGRLRVQSPFISPDVPVDDEQFFLSGDKVKLCGESGFSLHGRADAVTKVGGERVDLDEVRDVLQNQPGVEDCVVIALPDKTGRGNRIAALVAGDDLHLAGIRKELPRYLETAALPRVLKKIARIPITSSGKYDRQAIRLLLS